MGASAEIVAAGAVVTRRGPKDVEVLLVHRPKYDDWSFPKGKLDLGEHVTAAAVREVAEETGLDIRLGPPLSKQTYQVGNGSLRVKDVHYWAGRVIGEDDVSTYRANLEVDQVAWVPLAAAAERLSYEYDRDTLVEAEQVRRKSYPLLVVRHSRARPRGSWSGDDRDRPLSTAGKFQAEQLVPLLGAYGVEHVLSSSSKRCWQTVQPYADLAELDIEVTDELTEEGATGKKVGAHLDRLTSLKQPSVVCTHRPVLPWVFEALALDERKLEPGSVLVAHHRRGKVVAVEQHDVPFR